MKTLRNIAATILLVATSTFANSKTTEIEVPEVENLPDLYEELEEMVFI